MSSQGRGPRLRGRDKEIATLRDLLSTAQAGGSQVLVLRGEAGVGKTALLRQAAETADGFRRIQVTGVESDMELAYAGLHQLCAPLLHHLDELPTPQREALDVAFGRGVGAAPDRFLVGLAVLSLLAAATADQPLLCLVDDAQWLDQVSVQTLAFVARRFLAEPVVMLFAARNTGAEALGGLPELAITGLSDADARELLDSVLLARIDERVRDRVVAETRGIPLALLEVPRSVPAAELAGGFWNMATGRGVMGQVEDGYIRRIQALPPDAQRLLLLAAAEPVGDAALFVRAAANLGVPVDALAPAEAQGCIELGSRMRFRHPLMRSAAYRAANLNARRAVHRALADATDPIHDPDRRAWHAANAASGPDDVVAADLERSADRAHGKGGIAAAAAFMERATVLTADPALRTVRALAAAQAKRDAAAPAAAAELLAIAELGPLTDLQRAQVDRLRAQMEFARSRGGGSGVRPLSDSVSELLAAAKYLEALDENLARETYLEALAAAMYAGRLGAPGMLVQVAEAAGAALGDAKNLDRPVDLLLSGVTSRITTGDGGEQMRTALELMCSDAHEEHVLRWMSLGLAIIQESATGEVWDDTLYRQLATAAVGQARDAGALAVLPAALAFRAGVHMVAGEFSTATTLIDEAASIAAATDYAPLRYHSLSLAAFRGVPGEATGLIEAAAADARARGEGRVLGVTGYLSAVLYNGLGRYPEAFAAARDSCEYNDLGFHSWCLFELTEAAMRIGDKATAEWAVQRLAVRAGTSGTDWGLGALAHARAFIADDEDADALYTEAIERLERTAILIHLARTQLCYGEWLRRMNRRTDARKHLDEAYRMFSRMGAQAFAERARRELIAAGKKVRKEPVNSGDELTAQEAQIARLAGEGLTNQEIGAQLFISTHTVEWHLRKVFVKLGITSRRQLRTVFAAH
ncbi:helix-turn-helix transcriptional regulator [Mycolicibacterium llatzerense]|uniref:helix-turn-helix transcriptional regulator n=1 Tax=Mycolicibacterium llatzerense TaxID=280871 RepID=UPI0021B6B4E5|nr:LuxR family transcriptional regulator [Mycolicibacterium llatzerense]MCT7366672.1 LuxR family transcriptional regulator [Mycolicibacterium llatzerense]